MRKQITALEAAEQLSVARSTIYHWIATNKIKATRVGSAFRIDPIELEKVTRKTVECRVFNGSVKNHSFVELVDLKSRRILLRFLYPSNSIHTPEFNLVMEYEAHKLGYEFANTVNVTQ